MYRKMPSFTKTSAHQGPQLPLPQSFKPAAAAASISNSTSNFQGPQPAPAQSTSKKASARSKRPAAQIKPPAPRKKKKKKGLTPAERVTEAEERGRKRVMGILDRREEYRRELREKYDEPNGGT